MFSQVFVILSVKEGGWGGDGVNQGPDHVTTPPPNTPPSRWDYQHAGGTLLRTEQLIKILLK